MACTHDRSKSSADTRAPVRISAPAASARLPLRPARNPERHRDELQIEPEAGALQIQPIEAEFARAREIARRVHLRQPGQARPHSVTFEIPRETIERNEPAAAPRFDF